jgi:2-dehydropantoate 2-reductase
MRVIVYGAGAVGGVIGAKLFQHGHEVTFIARGPHFDAMNKNGVRLETPDETVTLRVPVVDDPIALSLQLSDVVILTVKSQDTMAALQRLARVASPDTAIVCGQNGVENERVALRLFKNVYGMCVMTPATHLEPGVVQVFASPISGLLDVGRWPAGKDDTIEELARMLTASSFDSIAREDIARWKWGKLLMNLGNAVEAVCGPRARPGQLWQRAAEEGTAVMDAAGIDYVHHDEDAERRGTLLNYGPVGASERGGGSTWQSLTRSTGSIETDFLTGEIVLQGRLHGVATPVNEVLQRLANQLAAQHQSPGFWSEDEVFAMLPKGTETTDPVESR